MTDEQMSALRLSIWDKLGRDAPIATMDSYARWLSAGIVPADQVASAPVADVPLKLTHSRKLGAKPPKRDDRVPRLSAIAPSLPPAPVEYMEYAQAVPSWILGENDRIGDCTCVGPANVILALTTVAGRPRRTPDTDIVSFYSEVSGYNAGDPNSDNGAMIEDVLAAWHSRGIGRQPVDMLDGYATIEPAHHDRVCEAIAALGPVDLGISLPNGWMTASTWDVSTAGEGIAGGHCITAVGFSAAGPLIVSWGSLFTLTWAGWDTYVTEAHALLSKDALSRAGKDVAGVDWNALEGFMAIIRGSE